MPAASPGPGLRADPDPFHDSHQVVDSDRVLVLHHADGAPSGQLLNTLVGRGIEPVIVRVTRGRDLPDPETVTAAIVVGSDRFRDAGTAGYLDDELDGRDGPTEPARQSWGSATEPACSARPSAGR